MWSIAGNVVEVFWSGNNIKKIHMTKSDCDAETCNGACHALGCDKGECEGGECWCYCWKLFLATQTECSRMWN